MTADGPNAEPPAGWADAWPDLLAFAAGLALAWFGHWQTKDLVWSLWLSSLLVGYAMIVWTIFGPGAEIARAVWQNRKDLAGAPKLPALAGGAILMVVGIFMLAFFTVHFGGFHYVHSIFLNTFFPVLPGTKGGPNLALYRQVLHDYWPFVFVAAIAERSAFRWPAADNTPPDTSVTAEAIAARKARNTAAAFGQSGMTAPYRNVMRMHLLIFFFAFVHFAKLDGFLVYAVVYAVYFFPWRLLKKAPAA